VTYGGFEYNPRLVPQAPAYYPQPQNPYAQYGPYNPMYNQGPYFPPQPAYGEDAEYEAPMNFLQEDQMQASTGAVTPTTTGGSVTPTASVQTPTDTSNSSPTGSPSPTTTSNMDALDIQLAAALDAVKADMISKGKQVLEEKQWTDDVKAVIDQYTKKISNVYANIEKLKSDMGDLYKKKQQIINAQIQKSLTQKLKDSKSDLSTVQAALDKVSNTQMEFEQSKKDIQSTIDSIFTQLAELKGTPASATGSASTGGGSDSSSVSQTDSSNSADTSSDSTPSIADSDTDIVDKTAEINSKIDTIKSIVSALNKGTSTSF